MLTLSSTLLAAQKRMDVDPEISVLVSDNPPEAPRLSELAAIYRGAEVDAPFDAAFVSGPPYRIARAYLASGVLRAQVVDPTVGNWSSWTILDAAASAYAPASCVAIWGSQSADLAYFFWVTGDTRTVMAAIWSAGAWVGGGPWAVASLAIGHVITGLASDGMDPTVRFFFAETYGPVYEVHWTGAAWTAPLSDGNAWYGLPTIACGFRPLSAPLGSGDTTVLIASLVAPSQPHTRLSIEHFGITGPAGWQGSQDIFASGIGSGYAYNYPKIAETRSDSLRQAISWEETGPAPLVGQAIVGFTPTRTALQGVVPWLAEWAGFGTLNSFGVKVFRDRQAVPAWWFLTSRVVYSCRADNADATIGQRVSFAKSQIRSFRLEVNQLTGRGSGQANTRSRGVLTVLNEGGYLASSGQAGVYKALRPRSQVSVALGYRSAAGGLETAWQMPLWIDGVIFHDEVRTGEPLVSFQLVDAWGILEVLRFRSTLTYLNRTVGYIVSRCLWHVCGVLGAFGAPLSSVTLSTFTVRAGEQVAVVLQRLCRLVGVELVFRTNATSVDGTGLDSVGVVAVVRGAGSSVYSYGGVNHPIVQSELEVARAPKTTGIAVAGAATQSISRNWVPMSLLWRDTLERVVDKTLATQAATDLVAGDEAAAMLTESAGWTISVLANVGQEVGDVVDVTIAGAGLVAKTYVVAGQVLTWSDPGGTGELRQRLELEAHA